MDYKESIALLEDALKFGIDPSLDPIQTLCAQLGNPQKRYQCIQVAGTNGKTSTARMIAALLRAQGCKVGLYTSPHLVKYPERMEVNGAVVSDEQFARGIDAAYRASLETGIQATEFELLTAAALWIFAQERLDWAVLECGLGGRWDATSVVDPKVAVITGVALDHTHILGNALEQIAEEKAAIIKAGSKAVLAQDVAAPEVFEARAAAVSAPVIYAGSLWEAPCESALAKLPSYQRSNYLTAVCAVEQALGEPLKEETIQKALAQLAIPGRFEILRAQPLVIIDAAHNPQSAHALAREIVRHFDVATIPESLEDVQRLPALDPVPTLLLGVLADKDAQGIIQELAPLFDRIVVTASSSPRAIKGEDLAVMVEERCGVLPELTQNIPEAIALLSSDSFLATGSITVAGELKEFW